MSAQKQKGTSWESAVVEYLRANGYPDVERRAANGVRDRGDISGLRGVVVECKNTARVQLSVWLDEANLEAANAGAPLGVAWAHRKGKSSPAHGYVVMDGAAFVRLLRLLDAS